MRRAYDETNEVIEACCFLLSHLGKHFEEVERQKKLSSDIDEAKVDAQTKISLCLMRAKGAVGESYGGEGKDDRWEKKMTSVFENDDEDIEAQVETFVTDAKKKQKALEDEVVHAESEPKPSS